MMQELRLVLIILGAVAIAALLLHGLWTSRKEKPAKFGEKPIGKLSDTDDTGFDQDGIGSVRVISSGSDDKPKADRKEPGLSFGDKSDVDPLFASEANTGVQLEKERDIDLPTFSASDVEEPTPVASASTEPPKKSPPVDFYQSHDDFDDVVNDEAHSDRELNVDAEITAEDVSEVVEVNDPEPVEEAPKAPEQQVLIINVQAGANKEFNGEELINCLEQHGMIFGEMEIYHRHADLAGTGQVLFSAANMFNPGSFPLATIHHFTTPGITLFMTLPCYGEAEQNFKLMLQTAQQVADQLGGLVTDDNRSMMTPQRLDSYRDKIKQFHSHA